MKYHYQQGVTEKDKKGHKKAWLGFFMVIGIVVYGGFIFTTLALNGWPLESVDTTAKIVKNVKPGSQGNRLFIPAINLNTSVKNSLTQSGNPEKSEVAFKGNQLAFGVTPSGLRSSSPFFNLNKLRTGDEIFLDNNNTRYVYKITKSAKNTTKKLTLQTKNTKLSAEAIGTIAWNNGSAELETF